MFETTSSTNCSNRSNSYQSTVKCQNRLALNHFDDKPLYMNPSEKFLWVKHTQSGNCPCLFCLKFKFLYDKDITENKTDKKFVYIHGIEKQVQPIKSSQN